MDLYLQFGHGMMEHCKCLVQKWGRGTIILSPRDLEPDQIRRFANEVIGLNGDLLLDPQLYFPRANHRRLTNHEYWPDDYVTGMFMGGPALRRLLVAVRELNDKALATKCIVPGIYCTRVNDDWCASQEAINDEAISVFSNKKRLATICLSAETLRFEEQIETILNCTESWDVDGYYVIAEHPKGQYLVEDPLWLANLLILCSGLKLQEKEVICGYASHQMLCLATANVDAIASGTWLNVRSFAENRFQQSEDDSASRRVKWYYCPQSLSEYKIPFLDMGFNAGILAQLKPDELFNSGYADVLFSGAQPSTTAYTEQQSFRHYLQCLHMQSIQAKLSSFRETLRAQVLLLDRAASLSKIFHNTGVRGQDRDFAEIVDINRAALSALDRTRGFVLEREW
jgi:hypothetical protein